MLLRQVSALFTPHFTRRNDSAAQASRDLALCEGNFGFGSVTVLLAVYC